MRILFGVTTGLCLSFLALCTPTTAWLQQPVQAETVPPSPRPSWQITSTATNVAIFVLDDAGTAVKEAYFLQETACVSPLPETLLTAKAHAAFANTATGQRMAFTLNAGGLIAESLDWTPDFFSWSVHLGDFTGKAFLMPCSGQVIFAGESIWMGHGVRPYLRDPLPASALLHLPTPIPQPSALTPVTDTAWLMSSDVLTNTVEAAWSTIADLNLLHDLAQHPFNVLFFLYRPATGYLDPAQELAQAEWIFVIYTEPATRAQMQFEHYLPLIRH